MPNAEDDTRWQKDEIGWQVDHVQINYPNRNISNYVLQLLSGWH